MEQPIPPQAVTPKQSIFAIGANVSVGPIASFIDFYALPESAAANIPDLRVHLTYEHAWVIAKLLDRTITQHIARGYRFTLPIEMLNQLGLIDEYREDFGEPPSSDALG